MSTSQQTPKIPLPKGWTKQVRSAVLHVLSLAQYAAACAEDPGGAFALRVVWRTTTTVA